MLRQVGFLILKPDGMKHAVGEYYFLCGITFYFDTAMFVMQVR
jgi:hypothetical protein